ncbi:MmgE/PrpD family protein [Halosolutus amylolyticus]|uniref:MmgE/PrpD family protein n=1 Tax=Halosolutus amylolyticus TaxID=2932267 RepID=A0ABD5PU67_9EURY|nr:MmgE/PrpD family protein [Halosolutus amylolyticus]
MTRADALSSFVATLSFEDLPAPVRDRVGLVVADTVGAIVGGAPTDPVRTLREQYVDRDSGPASVLGTTATLPRSQAAMLNGIAGTVLELDEGHKRAAGHPAIHVLPAVLAVAEADDGSVADLTTAFVAGYETAVRVARACQPLADGYHPHGVWGVVGATAAIANYEGLDDETVANALAIAANHAQQTRFEAALEGATVRDTYAGMVAPDAMRAVDQARAGFTGIENGVRTHLEHVAAEPIDDVPTDALGDRWEVLDGYFKVHAACRYTHPALDAIDDLSIESSIDADDVDRVTVETYPAAATLSDPEPTSRLAAKFSIPFAVASRIVHGHARKAAFEPAAFEESVYDLAGRVAVESTPEFADAVPESRGARVTIDLDDATRSATVRHARGGAQRPFDEARLREKFHALVDPVLGRSDAEEAWTTLRTLSPTDVRSLCLSTRPDGAE